MIADIRLQNHKVQANKGRRGSVDFRYTQFILSVNSKHKNGTRCAGKEETRCQGVGQPIKRREQI